MTKLPKAARSPRRYPLVDVVLRHRRIRRARLYLEVPERLRKDLGLPPLHNPLKPWL